MAQNECIISTDKLKQAIIGNTLGDDRRMYTVDEAARYLNEPLIIIPLLVQNGELKSYYFNKKLLFRKDDLVAYKNQIKEAHND